MDTSLGISLMGLQAWAVTSLIGPLLLIVAVQVVLACAFALVLAFPLLGRSYAAAVTSGGPIGYRLASMPVVFGTMEELISRFGPSPRAFLLVTLVASFSVDLAYALVARA